MIKSIIENIGDKTINFFVSILDAMRIALVSVLFLFLPASYTVKMRETLVKQIYFTSIQPLILFLFLAFLFGTSILGAAIAIAVQYNLQDKIALIIVKFSINEYAPFFTALFMALHSGTYISEKLMQMKLNGELKTLIPILLPRVLSGMLSALSLGVLVALMTVFSGYIFSLFYLHMELSGYLFTLKNTIEINDLIVFITKSTLFGFLIMFLPIIHAVQNISDSQLLARSVLKSILKLLVALFFLEVLSFVLQSF